MDPKDFKGKIGRDWRDSEPWWPEPVRPPEGAPNVVLIVLDDVGFAQLGCYGSDLATPAIDRLAARGLRYTNFHTTALCSPTRACLLTGRNHHSVGMARVADLARGFPGYSGMIPKSCGFLPEILRERGYATYAVGKWHLCPESHAHLAASRGTWPLGRGFERYYGYFGGETHQYSPALVHDNHFIEAPYDESYHLTEDLADHAIELLTDLRAVDAEKRFFLYFCTGACHSPHQAPRKWIDEYRGRFDAGWDVWREATFARQVASGIVPPGTELSPRPPWVPAWSELSDEERPLAIRFMECFAGFLSHADAQIGRVISFLEELGELDDTLVILLSDNGASSEGGKHGSINDLRLWNVNPAGVAEMLARLDEFGGPTIHNNYPWGWTMAGNTPLRRWKRETHEGGVADPCIVHWPSRIAARGEVRRQFVHAIDVAPTVLDLCRIEAPATLDGFPQKPIEGASFAATLADPAAATRGTQYYEMLGSRAIYHEGWKAVAFKPLGPMYSPTDDANRPWDDDPWELYHVAEDFSECRDLAAQEPERLRALVDLWWQEAEKYQVLPLDNRIYIAILEPPPTGIPPRERYVYRPGGSRVPEEVAVDVKGRPHAIVADVVIPSGGAEGVLLAMGSILGGYSFFVADGRLQYVHNFLGREEHHVDSEERVPEGKHRLGFVFEAGKNARLTIDGRTVGTGSVPRFTPVRFSITDAGLTCGEDAGSAVTRRYRAPFRFTGKLDRVTVHVAGPGVVDPDALVESKLRTQ
ncbi:MAG: arylsulfatase [Deltaproteobacteria bacterium]|nr:arylsulfatase [Deltaproteobacteria bacterium]